MVIQLNRIAPLEFLLGVEYNPEEAQFSNLVMHHCTTAPITIALQSLVNFARVNVTRAFFISARTSFYFYFSFIN
jgi:hypothetical protein